MPDYAQLPASDLAAIRCENCGLLAQLDYAREDYTPATENFRRSAAISFDTEKHGTTHSPAICAISKRVFVQGSTEGEFMRVWLGQLRQDRAGQCGPDAFVQWVPGLSIRDHKETLDRARMLKFQAEQRERDEARAEADRVWRAEQARLEREWRQAQANDARAWRVAERNQENYWQRKQLASQRSETRWVAGGVAVAAVVGLAALVASVIFRGGSGTTINNPTYYNASTPVATASR